MYRTRRVAIKNGHKLHHYCEDMCQKAYCLYNRANFVVRQYVTAQQAIRNGKPLFANQKAVLDLVEQHLSGTKYMPTGDWFSYGKMDYLLKVTKDPDYYALPAHANQHVLNQLFQDYKSFFESIKAYAKNSSSFTGRPKMPRYKKVPVSLELSNQVCVIKDNRYLKLPKTKAMVNLGPVYGQLMTVRITKSLDSYIVEAVFDVPDTGITEDENIIPDSAERVMSIDPGINNLCAVTGTAGIQPFLINGRILKSITHCDPLTSAAGA